MQVDGEKMGIELTCICEKCGYEFEADVGVGFLYPKVYVETIDAMKEGRFGQQGKEFLEAFPNGAISCENIVVQCNDCKKLMVVPELSLYVPKEGYDFTKSNRKKRWSSGFSGNDYEYVSPIELNDHYQLFEEYDHRCLYCNGHTSVVPGFTECMDKSIDKRVSCPECGSMIEINFTGIWD